jgi:hypothetical protein
MPDQDTVEEAAAADPTWDDLEKRFPPEAFVGVAQAVGLPFHPQNTVVTQALPDRANSIILRWLRQKTHTV